MKIPDLAEAANKMAVGHLIEIRTKSDIVLADRKETDDPMALLWRDIANRVGPVYHYKGLGTYIITRDSVGNYKLAVNTIKETELRVLAGKEAYQHLIRYIIENKRFSSEPKMNMQQWVWDDSGNMRPDMTDATLCKSMFEARASVDLGNGNITVYVPYITPLHENNAEIEKMLKIVLGERVQLFKMFLSQMLFEHRVNLAGRPSLIMWGDRGAGKGFIVESVIKSFMPQMCCPIPNDWDKFNNFQRFKFLYLDENERNDMDLSNIYTLAKRLSGGKVDMVGGKFQEKEQIKMCNYFCAISNGKPIHMKDTPTSDKDNQWVAIRFHDKLDTNKEFLDFREKHGANLEVFIRDHAGCYLRDILLPLYASYSTQYRRTHRYGFPIPLSADLRELCDMSETQGDTAFWGIMQDLETMTISEFIKLVEDRKWPTTLIPQFDEYQTSGFLTSNLVNFFNNIKGTSRDLTMKKVREVVKKSKIEHDKKKDYTRIKGTFMRGVRIDRDKYRKVLNSSAVEDGYEPEIQGDVSFDPADL